MTPHAKVYEVNSRSENVIFNLIYYYFISILATRLKYTTSK